MRKVSFGTRQRKMKNFEESEKLLVKALKSNLSDADLMSLLARGRMEPLGELYLRYGGMVRTLLWRLLPTESSVEAEDICHDVFMTVFDIAERFNPGYELRPWLFGIAVRKARSWRRKKWLREKLLRVRTSEAMPVEPAPNAAGEAISLHHEIDRAIKSLPPAQSEVLIMYVTHSMNGEQIAQSLGVPVNTVWTRLRRARLAMRAAIEDEGEGKNEIGGPK